MTALCNRRTLAVLLLALAAALPAAGQFHQIPIGISLLTQLDLYSEPATTSYEIIGINPLVAWDHATTQAYAVNNAGQVLGNYSTPDYVCYTGAIWEAGVFTSVDSSASQQSDINELGHAVATRTIVMPEVIQRAILWRDGQEIELDNIPGQFTFAGGMNDVDQVVGSYDNGSYADKRAYLWDAGVVTTLPGLAESWAAASDINNAGQIAGTAQDAHGVRHAVRWERVAGQWAITNLGPPAASSGAAAMNEAGDVVGAVRQDGWAHSRPALFSGGSVTILTETHWGLARGINNAGDVVGDYELSGGHVESVFLWSGGVFTDLHDLLSPADRADWELVSAYDINDDGWIVGIGHFRGGWEMMRGFILRPCESVSSAEASPAATTP